MGIRTDCSVNAAADIAFSAENGKREADALRMLAFFGVCLSTVSMMISVVTVPLAYQHFQQMGTHMQNELDFCQARAGNIWREVTRTQAYSHASGGVRNARQAVSGYGGVPPAAPLAQNRLVRVVPADSQSRVLQDHPDLRAQMDNRGKPEEQETLERMRLFHNSRHTTLRHAKNVNSPRMDSLGPQGRRDRQGMQAHPARPVMEDSPDRKGLRVHQAPRDSPGNLVGLETRAHLAAWKRITHPNKVHRVHPDLTGSLERMETLAHLDNPEDQEMRDRPETQDLRDHRDNREAQDKRGRRATKAKAALVTIVLRREQHRGTDYGTVMMDTVDTVLVIM
uniref:Col_cuticle_N domain-containing protein n=1 Tax=Globodera pallida TaxID=36090 RepID=A0A183C6L4_GLOPA